MHAPTEPYVCRPCLSPHLQTEGLDCLLSAGGAGGGGAGGDSGVDGLGGGGGGNAKGGSGVVIIRYRRPKRGFAVIVK